MERELSRLLFLSKESSDPKVSAAYAAYTANDGALKLTEAPSEESDAG